jgi:hypothetical protein
MEQIRLPGEWSVALSMMERIPYLEPIELSYSRTQRKPQDGAEPIESMGCRASPWSLLIKHLSVMATYQIRSPSTQTRGDGYLAPTRATQEVMSRDLP